MNETPRKPPVAQSDMESQNTLRIATEQIAAWRAEARQKRRQEYAAKERGSITVLSHGYTADTLERVADQLELALGLTRPAVAVILDDTPPPF